MEKIKFNNGKLTILQISDAQDTQWVRKTMLAMLNKACDRINPDLIIFTGDNILGNHLNDQRFGTGQRKLSRGEQYKILETAIHHVIDIPELRNIPFAIIFGNHDDRNSFTKEEQADIFRACRMNRGLETTGRLCGTYRLPVYSTDGENNVFDIYMIDTAYFDHAAGEGFEEITPEAVEWYKKEAEENQNPAMMFMHIPFKELEHFVETDGNGKVLGLRNGAVGDVGEHVCPLPEDNGFYEAVRSNGNTKMIVSGHDHTNSFVVPYKDIDIIEIGLRPGEKLYEEILMEEEGLKSTSNHMIHIGRPIELDETQFFKQLKGLEVASKSECADIRPLIKEIVPTYTYKEN